jgi:hypothetical protein
MGGALLGKYGISGNSDRDRSSSWEKECWH